MSGKLGSLSSDRCAVCKGVRKARFLPGLGDKGCWSRLWIYLPGPFLSSKTLGYLVTLVLVFPRQLKSQIVHILEGSRWFFQGLSGRARNMRSAFDGTISSRLMITLLLMFALNPKLDGQLRWEPLQPFDGGRVKAIRLVNDRLFVVNERLHFMDGHGQWHETHLPIETPRWNWLSLDYGNGLYLLAGARDDGSGRCGNCLGELLSSRDGLNWESVMSLPNVGFNSVRYLGGQWLLNGGEWIPGESAYFVMNSQDGRSWDRHEVTGFFELFPELYVDGLFLARTTFGFPLSSEDGISWEEITVRGVPGGGIQGAFGLFYENETFLFVVHRNCPWVPGFSAGCSTPLRVFISKDGRNWRISHAEDVNGFEIFYLEPTFVLLTKEGVEYSRDGDNWRKIEVTNRDPHSYDDVVYFSGYFYGTGQKEEVWRSPLAIELSFDFNWRYLPWFGFYNDILAPWIYHDEIGWLWRETEQIFDPFWFWDVSLGYLWTGNEVYPSIYRERDSAWIWYARETSDPRYFFNFSTDEWETW